jgi:hypothetical protein
LIIAQCFKIYIGVFFDGKSQPGVYNAVGLQFPDETF